MRGLVRPWAHGMGPSDGISIQVSDAGCPAGPSSMTPENQHARSTPGLIIIELIDRLIIGVATSTPGPARWAVGRGRAGEGWGFRV